MKQFSGRVSMVLWESYVPTYICRAAVLFEVFFFPTRQAVSILPIPKFSFVRFPHLISEEFSVNNIFSLGVRHCVTFTETNLQWKGCKNVENKWGNNSCVRIGFLRVEKRAQLPVGNCEAYLNFILNALLYGKTWSITLKCLCYSDIDLVFSDRKQLFPMWEDTCFHFFLRQKDYREQKTENLLTFASKYRKKPMRNLCWGNRFHVCVHAVLCLIFVANWNGHLRRHWR